MSKKVRLISKNKTFSIELNNTRTAGEIFKLMPFLSRANRWGDEIYFQIPLHTELENGVEVLDIGSVAYWPAGNSLCIFFGKTPVSVGEEPRAAGPVTIVGKITDGDEISKLKEILDGDKVELQK